MRQFKSIFNFRPISAVISSESEVKRDESLTISQIISLHLRGLSSNLHVYDEVEYENGNYNYSDEPNNDDYYELESDFTDFNPFVDSSGDNHSVQVLEPSPTSGDRSRDNKDSGVVDSEAITE